MSIDFHGLHSVALGGEGNLDRVREYVKRSFASSTMPYVLYAGSYLVGRDDFRNQRLDSFVDDKAFDHISLDHMGIFRNGNDTYIIDKDSTNGTFINGVRQSSDNASLLNPGDVVSLGATETTGEDELIWNSAQLHYIYMPALEINRNGRIVYLGSGSNKPVFNGNPSLIPITQTMADWVVQQEGNINFLQLVNDWMRYINDEGVFEMDYAENSRKNRDGLEAHFFAIEDEIPEKNVPGSLVPLDYGKNDTYPLVGFNKVYIPAEMGIQRFSIFPKHHIWGVSYEIRIEKPLKGIVKRGGKILVPGDFKRKGDGVLLLNLNPWERVTLCSEDNNASVQITVVSEISGKKYPVFHIDKK